MAQEIQISYQTGRTLDYLLRDQQGRVWSTSGGTGGFESPYASANYASYVIAMTEQGTSAYYTGSVPAAVPAGLYSVTAKVRSTGSPLETDQTVGAGDLNWQGSKPVGLSDLASSGQVAQLGPMRIARGTMLSNFRFKLVSDADNKTPFVSGVCSGQIGRDSGSFAPLQSGAFTEYGMGHYGVTLTSGDLLCDTASLVITANGVSGGRAAQRDFTFVTQRVSGSL